MPSWVDITWPMMAAASLTLGLIHALVWMHQGSRAHLAFSAAAVSVALLTVLDLYALKSATPAGFAELLRWRHVPLAALVLAIIWFFHESMGGAYLRLGLAAGGLRVLGMALGFITGDNLNFDRTQALEQVSWWGGVQVSYAVGTVNPWVLVAMLSNFLLLAYVALNLARAWRQGDRDQRRMALVVCGSWLAFILVMVVSAILMMLDWARMPFLGSPAFLAVILATSYQLGLELSRSASLTRELGEARLRSDRSEQDLARTTRFGELELWDLDLSGEAAGASSDTIQALLDRVHDSDRRLVERALAQALGDGRLEVEFRERSPVDGVRWTSMRGEVEFDDERQARRLLAITRDVSERHDAAERFRSLFESAPIALMLVDPQGRIALANDLVAAIFGGTRDRLEGSPVDDLVPERSRCAHAGHRSTFNSHDTVLMAAGRELTGLRLDGSEVPVEVGLKQVDLAGGTYTLATVTDVTLRKRSEAESTRQLDELAHLSRVTVIGELSGSLAHELNQPLAAILSNAQAAQRVLANDPNDTQDLQEILADIVEDDRRAGEVIRRMRLMLKKGHVDHTPVDLNALATDALRLMRSDMIHRTVDAGVELAPELPMVDADPVQLQQVLVNLVINACDALEGASGPRIVRVRTAATPDGGVRVSVQDNGPGIAPGMLQRIFEPFETSKPQGMGLGLAVCRSILDAHGGRIWAENAPDGGARIVFEISRPGSRT